MATKSSSKSTASKSTIKSIQQGIKNVQKGINDYKNSLNSDKEQTAGQVYKQVKVAPYDSTKDAGIDKALKYYGDASGNFDEGDIRGRQLSLFQKEIDATNAIYADQLASAALDAKNRLGSTRAMSARSGTLGSDFGNTQKENTIGLNQSIEGGIRAEQNAAIGAIMGKARDSANAEIAAKKAAQKEGLDKYLEFLGEKNTRKEQYKTDLANTFIDQGIKPEEVDPKQLEKIAKSYGLKTDDVITTYTSVKKAADEAKAAADLKAKKDNSFNLSEGQDRYEYDPVTGEYHLVASKAKTFAPKAGTGSGVTDGNYSPAAKAWAKQIENGQATFSQVPKEIRNEVAQALAAPGVSASKKLELETTLKTLDELLANPKLKRLSGTVDQFTGGLTGKSALAKNQYNQLKGILALDSRQKLNGSGAISDFEFKVLSEASSALGRNLSDADFRKEITKVRGAFQSALDRANLIEQNGGTDIPAEPTDTTNTTDNRSNTLTDSEGNSFDASSLTDEEYQNALDDGYTPQ